MKFSELWLREWVNPDVSTTELAHIMTMAGLEVESIEPVAGEFTHIIVGQVKSIEAHPDADKLKVCSVDVAGEELLQIVCGAANVAVGMKVPTALVGATLPGGMKIKKAKLRGVQSFGMLCSSKELGMAESADGLMALSADAEIGKDIRKYFWLDDQSIELSVTPNRGDCLSIAGIAREVGTLCKTPVTTDKFDIVQATIEKKMSVMVEVPQDCPRYLCRVIEGINPDAETPMWIQEALRRSGLRSISPVVDVTNFVLLELGQPMHAFDLNKLTGGICVRKAMAGEKITLLDGQQLTLDTETMVISDDIKALALAGIMGGEDSAVSAETTNIVLESAFFNPLSIAGKARSYGLHTDSSHRFERGVDPELQSHAMERATNLLVKIVGGSVGPVVEIVVGAFLPVRNNVILRAERIERVLGHKIPDDEVLDILKRLGMQVEVEGANWRITPPSFRFDIEIEEDLIEEVARVYGYEKLPTTLPQSGSKMQPCPESEIPVSLLQQILVARGYQEAITYSFVDPELQKLLHPEHEAIALKNPISADMSVMRTSHWPGLLQAVLYNLNRQQLSVKFFEKGLKFLGQRTDIKQDGYISGVITGNSMPEQWGEASRLVDFFDMKNDIEALFSTAMDVGSIEFRAEPLSAFHPGQSAGLYDSAGHNVGYAGALHPTIQDKLGLSQPVYMFEIALKCFENAAIPHFSVLSKYPSVRRDLAVIVKEDVTIDQLKNVVNNASTDLLENFQLFDVYQGKGIDSGRKSVAFGLTFQDPSRTLDEAEIERALEPILTALANKLGATLRK